MATALFTRSKEQGFWPDELPKLTARSGREERCKQAADGNPVEHPCKRSAVRRTLQAGGRAGGRSGDRRSSTPRTIARSSARSTRGNERSWSPSVTSTRGRCEQSDCRNTSRRSAAALTGRGARLGPEQVASLLPPPSKSERSAETGGRWRPPDPRAQPSPEGSREGRRARGPRRHAELAIGRRHLFQERVCPLAVVGCTAGEQHRRQVVLGVGEPGA